VEALRSGDGARRGGAKLGGGRAGAAEQSTRASEDHYRHAVELNPQVSWTALPDGQLNRVAQALVMTGRARPAPARAGPEVSTPRIGNAPSMVWGQRRDRRAYDIEHRVKMLRRRLSLGALACLSAPRRGGKHRALVRHDRGHPRTQARRGAAAAADQRTEPPGEEHAGDGAGDRLPDAEGGHSARRGAGAVRGASAGACRGAQHADRAELGGRAAAPRRAEATAISPGRPDRVAGPRIWLAPRAALALALALHELSTNAAKYGALCGEEGRVSVDPLGREWRPAAPRLEGAGRAAIVEPPRGAASARG
jgi:hypothetical protein